MFKSMKQRLSLPEHTEVLTGGTGKADEVSQLIYRGLSDQGGPGITI